MFARIMKLLETKGRRYLDAYMTPPYFVDVLREAIDIQGNIFEPCVGDGAIARFFPDCVTNDIDTRWQARYHFDASQPWNRQFPTRLDWVITNPPFSKAYEILLESLDHAPRVAMLLRISFLEPTKQRCDFLELHPPTGLIYLPRYSFKQNGKSDMATVMWAIWGHKMTTPIQIAKRFPNGTKE